MFLMNKLLNKEKKFLKRKKMKRKFRENINENQVRQKSVYTTFFIHYIRSGVRLFNNIRWCNKLIKCFHAYTNSTNTYRNNEHPLIKRTYWSDFEIIRRWEKKCAMDVENLVSCNSFFLYKSIKWSIIRWGDVVHKYM